MRLDTRREAHDSSCPFDRLSGGYIWLTGLVLLIAPNILLSTFGLGTTTEVWIRVLGCVVTSLGAYYRVMGKANAAAFFPGQHLGAHVDLRVLPGACHSGHGKATPCAVRFDRLARRALDMACAEMNRLISGAAWHRETPAEACMQSPRART